MAKTFEELKSQANLIKNETIPAANSATRVGGTILDMVEKSEGTDTETKKLIKGQSANTDPKTDPHKWLGEINVDTEGGQQLKALLDGMNTKEGCGYYRGSFGGSLFEVETIGTSFADGNYAQSIRGSLSISSDKMSLQYGGSYRILRRTCTNNTWGQWAEYSTIDLVQTTGSSTTSAMSQDAVTKELNKKQSTLKSGTNLKTVNNQSLLGIGNIQIPTTTVVQTTGNSKTSVMSQDTVTKELKERQETLVSGTNIKTINNQSILGPGNITMTGGGVIPLKSGTDTTIEVQTTTASGGELYYNNTTNKIYYKVGGKNYTDWNIEGYYERASVCGADGTPILGGMYILDGTLSYYTGDNIVAISSGADVHLLNGLGKITINSTNNDLLSALGGDIDAFLTAIEQHRAFFDINNTLGGLILMSSSISKGLNSVYTITFSAFMRSCDGSSIGVSIVGKFVCNRSSNTITSIPMWENTLTESIYPVYAFPLDAPTTQDALLYFGKPSNFEKSYKNGYKFILAEPSSGINGNAMSKFSNQDNIIFVAEKSDAPHNFILLKLSVELNDDQRVVTKQQAIQISWDGSNETWNGYAALNNDELLLLNRCVDDLTTGGKYPVTAEQAKKLYSLISTGGADSLPISGVLNLTSGTTALTLGTIYLGLANNTIRFYIVGDSKGTIPSTETYVTVNSSVKTLIGAGGASVGDILIVGKLESKPVYKLLPLNDAKAATANGSFPGADGLETVWDKTQINKIAGIESKVNANNALTRDGSNMNDCLETGFYPWCTLGRPAGATGAFSLAVRRSSTADSAGFYTVEQTCFGREAELGQVYTRLVFIKSDGTSDFMDWIRIDSSYLEQTVGQSTIQIQETIEYPSMGLTYFGSVFASYLEPGIYIYNAKNTSNENERSVGRLVVFKDKMLNKTVQMLYDYKYSNDNLNEITETMRKVRFIVNPQNAGFWVDF